MNDYDSILGIESYLQRGLAGLHELVEYLQTLRKAIFHPCTESV